MKGELKREGWKRVKKVKRQRGKEVSRALYVDVKEQATF